jgi:phosphate transport system substrate-binding protein
MPLSRPLFIYVNRKSADRPEIKKFIEFYLANGEKMAEVVGYIPLNASDYPQVLERFLKLQLGTSFGGGSSEGKTLSDILSTPPQA